MELTNQEIRLNVTTFRRNLFKMPKSKDWTEAEVAESLDLMVAQNGGPVKIPEPGY